MLTLQVDADLLRHLVSANLSAAMLAVNLSIGTTSHTRVFKH